MSTYTMIRAIFVILALLAYSGASAQELQYSARTFEELEAHFRADPRVYEIREITVDDQQIVAVVTDGGSGVRVLSMQLFAKFYWGWNLVIFQRTNARHISFAVDEQRHELVAVANGDDVILRVPIKSLR